MGARQRLGFVVMEWVQVGSRGGTATLLWVSTGSNENRCCRHVCLDQAMLKQKKRPGYIIYTQAQILIGKD